MEYYDIWKIIGWGRKYKRYYESEKMFDKYWEKAKKQADEQYPVEAHRFTSSGWILIKWSCGSLGSDDVVKDIVKVL